MSVEAPHRTRGRAFTVRGLTKVYGDGAVAVHALRGVDLDLFEGEITVLLGPSGSGKSTLLNIIGGLDLPSAGQVLFRDQEITAFDERALTRFRRDHIGFVFQFYNLIPSLTACENVELITEIACEAMQGRTPMQKVALYTSGVIFAVGAVGHVVRLTAGFEIVVGGVVVPVWVSVPGALIAGLLAVWMVVAARRS